MPITITRLGQWTIGELSKASQIHVETIRYFEKIGLIPKAQRLNSGHRRFGPDHLGRLNFIRRARDMGFSQGEIRALIGLSDGEAGSCAEVKAIADAHLRVIRQKIEGLGRLERLLSQTSAKCSRGRTPACPIIAVLSGGEGEAGVP